MTMTGKQRKPSKKKVERSPSQTSGKMTDSTILKYTGPLMIPKSLNQDHVICVNFSYFFPLNATVGGVVDNAYSDQSVVSANDWANIAGSFHEFRVLAFQMHFEPLVSYTTNYPAFVTVIDRSVATTLGGYTSAANHESCQLWSSRYPKRVIARMDGPEEADWVSTTTSSNKYFIKHYGTGFTASQNVGNILFTYLVQFRGRA